MEADIKSQDSRQRPHQVADHGRLAVPAGTENADDLALHQGPIGAGGASLSVGVDGACAAPRVFSSTRSESGPHGAAMIKSSCICSLKTSPAQPFTTGFACVSKGNTSASWSGRA